jgi:hypothetical protein
MSWWTALTPGQGSLLAGVGGGLLSLLGQNSANHSNRSMQYDMAKNGLSWKIQDAAKHGIHPLAAIGAAPGPMPTIPMQNSLAGMSTALVNHANTLGSQDPVSAQIKQYTLDQLRRESENAKWDYSLLIPVDHPQYPGLKFWGFNQRYQSYGTFANGVVLAANKDQALELLKGQMSEKEKAQAKRAEEDLKRRRGTKDLKPYKREGYTPEKVYPPEIDTDIAP